MTRWIMMLFFALLALIPAMFAWREFGIIYDGLWKMYEDGNFQQEMLVRGHIFNALLWTILVAVFVGLCCHVSSTPEERRQAKERRQRELDEQARECVRLKPAPRMLERRDL